MDQWYYTHEGQQFGPHSLADLQHFAAILPALSRMFGAGARLSPAFAR